MNSVFTSALFLSLLLFPSMGQAQEQSLPRLKIVGNHFESVDGTPVSLRGVSLCSLDWHKPLGLLESAATTWNPNIIRLPVQPREWKKTDPARYLKDKLDPAVKLCVKHNVYCIIDWHQISNWQDEEKNKKLEEFWSIVAPRYAGNPHILYEVYNEPTEPKSRNRENWIAFRDKMQVWVDKIREDAPQTVLLIGSPSWSQLPAFAVADPLKGDNLAYVMHPYPGNFPAKTWDKAFGNASKTIPIFLSEWGWTRSEKAFHIIRGTQEAFGEPLKQYLQERPHIGWTAWSYDPKCGPAMLGSDAEMGAFVKQWLSEPVTPPKAD